MSIEINIDGFTNGVRAHPVQRVSREHGYVTGTITFDNSYAEGGELVSGATVVDTNSKKTSLAGFFGAGAGQSSSNLLKLEIELPNGFTFTLDTTTKGSEKIRVFDPHVPPIVHEETFDAASDLAYLKYPAAHIEYVASEAAPFQPIFGGVTPTAGMVAIAMGYNTTTGVHTKGTRPALTFYAADGIALTYGAAGAFATGMVCSYVTQSWKDVSDNMESCKLLMDGSDITAAASGYWSPQTTTWTQASPDVLTLGTDIVAVTSHTWSDGGTIKVPVTVLGVSGTVTASTDIEIDFIKAGSAEILYLAADTVDAAGDILWIQYIKRPGTLATAGGFLAERFRNTTIAASGDDCIFTGNPLMYATCGQIPSIATAKAQELTSEFDTVAALQSQWTDALERPHSSGIPTIVAHADTDTNTEPAWIEGAIGEIETQAIEVPGADYSGWGALKFRITGHIDSRIS